VEFEWAEPDAQFRKELQDFLGENLPASWEQIAHHGPGADQTADFSRSFCAKLAERGWLTQSWPAQYGGEDASPWRHAVVSEEMWQRGEPRGSQYMNVNWIGPTIMEYGSEEQKRDHLSRISRGGVLWCQGFSEPEAGSDLASLRTRAWREGDDYVVDGTKIWTSYVNGAEYCFLLVRTDPESKGGRGITVLLAPMDAPGIVVREIPAVIGERYFHELFFDRARIPAHCRLGAEGEGWGVVRYALAYERVGAARYARAARTLDSLAAHAREQGLFDDPAVQEKLGAALTLVEAARILTYRVIDLRARGSAPTADTNLARIAGTLCENAVSDLAVDLLGTQALAYGHAAEAYFRMAMTAGVAVGTTEMNLDLVAGRHLGLPRS